MDKHRVWTSILALALLASACSGGPQTGAEVAAYAIDASSTVSGFGDYATFSLNGAVW